MPNIKNKKELIYIIFITGVLLLLIGRTDIGTNKEIPQANTPNITDDTEQRLEDALSMAEGVGAVKVVIYYKNSGQKTIAKDKTEETDDSKKHFEERVALSGGGEPIVLRENMREIEGVLIIAQGGADPKIRAKLISAAQALLGIETHKIEVLKMK